MNPRYLLLLLAVCLLIGGVQAWGADMGAWDYRKEITVNNAGAEQTNYQLKFTINRDTGVDSGFTVYVDDKCESDYDDIRFTTGENTLCDYWIESSSSSTASVWVEVPTIAAGDTTMYLYYGNAGASAASNGTNTFPLFDDFLGDTLNTTLWTQNGADVTVSSSIMSSTPTSNAWMGITSKTAYSTGYTMRSRFKSGHFSNSANYEKVGWKDATETNSINAYFAYPHVDYGKYYYNTDGTTGSRSSISGFTAATFCILECKRTSSSAVWSVDDANVVTVSSHYPTGSYYLFYWAYGSGSAVYADWILIRKYTATELTLSAWGSEEEQYPKYLIVDFSGVPTSGYVPLTVYFTDASVGYNVTLDTWAWSFGDTSPNSTQQDPAHTYTTSGLYSVILTVTNTSFSKTNTTQKTAYINATTNLDAPNADFTVTELCGSTTDTFYFIDFSTGGGLYQWNWSFGDGSYSELRNPTHQYAGNGTYSVNLTVWGAYGSDYLLRSNLIAIPCGAATPTPTVTPTGTITPGYTGTIPNKPIVTGTITPTSTAGEYYNWSFFKTGEFLLDIKNDLLPVLFTGLGGFIPILIIIIAFGACVVFVEGWIRIMR